METLRSKQKSIGIKYGILTGLYWMGFAYVVGFAAVQLQDRGISNTSIGLMLSVAAALSIWIQAGPASIVDRVQKASVKLVLGIMTGAVLLMGFCYLFLKQTTWVLTVFAVMAALTTSMGSLIYSMAMEYLNYQVEFNVGVCRSMGSLCCGTISLITGFLIKRFGTEILIPMLLLNDVLFLGVILSMENPRKYISQQSFRSGSREKGRGGYGEFFRKYRGILFLMIGFILLYMSGSAMTNFQINIVRNIGGDETTLGIANGIGPYAEIPIMAGFGFFIARMKSRDILRLSTLFYILRITCYCLASRPETIIAVQLLQGVSYGLFTMSSVYYMNEITEPGDNVKGQALLGVVTTGFSSILASFLGGLVLDALGVRAMLYMCVGFTVAGALIIWACTGKRQNGYMREDLSDDFV